MDFRETEAYPSPIASNSLKPLLVCFSHLRWSFVWQRPQHLLSRAARDYRVLFIEEPLPCPSGEPHLDLSYGPGAVTVAVPVLPAALGPAQQIAARRQLVEDLLEQMGSRIAISWFYTPMALDAFRHIESDLCVYDCMDELSAFLGAPPDLKKYESLLFARADIVFTGGRSLHEAKRGRHHNVHCLPSSIDAAHFRQARAAGTAEPADQASIGRPRIGFFGVIDERMDTGLLANLADLRPQWHFVMVGPVAKIDPATLPCRPNIHWLGPKQYEELPSYLAGWDLGFMPFAMNDATRLISPTKTPEFLAAGLPVLSTPVTDVVRAYGEPGFVEVAGNAEDMATKASNLLGRRRTRWLARVDRLLNEMSWDATWQKMSQELERARMGRSALKRPLRTPPTRETGVATRV